MKNKLFPVVLIVFFVLAQLTFAAGQKDDSAAEEKIVITFAHENAVGSVIDQTANKFKELVEAKSDKVEVRVFPAAQLGDDQQNMEGMKLGTIQMTMGNPDYLAKRVPEFVVFTLPFMFSGWDHVEKAMDSDVARELDQMLIDQEGFRVLMWGHNGFRVMATKTTPIRTMADVKGVKFRSPQIPVYVKMFQAIGANPTPIPWPEAYNALKQGVVDGLEGGPDPLLNANIFEVAKYLTRTNHLYTAMMLLIDDNFYNGLPKDVSKAIDDASAELQAWQREMVKVAVDDVFIKVKENGVTIIEMDTTEMQEACKSVWVELTADSPTVIEFADKITALGN